VDAGCTSPYANRTRQSRRAERTAIPMTKKTTTKTTTPKKPATRVTAKTDPTPGVCRKCGFTLSGTRTRCRVAAACAKRQKAAA
jgi:hypothetical protein